MIPFYLCIDLKLMICNRDFSNYWTAVMFFKAKNGTYKRVPQTGNGGPQGKLVNNGGLDVYYIPNGKTTAFKKVAQPVSITITYY
jgi:hypothetical protein